MSRWNWEAIGVWSFGLAMGVMFVGLLWFTWLTMGAW
jgi:hypothetical protein